jgi:hypothetical protein
LVDSSELSGADEGLLGKCLAICEWILMRASTTLILQVTRDRLYVHRFLAFDYLVELVCSEVVEGLVRSAGPADIDQIDDVGGAETK